MQDYFYIVGVVALFLGYITLAGIAASLSRIANSLSIIAENMEDAE